jgi:hypothetical protein
VEGNIGTNSHRRCILCDWSDWLWDQTDQQELGNF